MITEKDIIEAYTRIRTIDNTIPDEVLDFIKNASIKQLRIGSVVVPKGTFACHEELEGRQKCDRQCSRIDCHYLNQEAS